MRTFKIIVLIFNCIFLAGVLHAGFFEREVSEFIENDGEYSHAILAICPGKDDEALFILTKTDSLDKGTMDCEGRMCLWSISQQRHILRRTILKEEKQKEIIFAPINDGAMAFTHKNNLLVISSSRIIEDNYQGQHNLPIHYKFLPADIDISPDSITIKIMEKEYNMMSSLVMAKILPLNQSYLTTVSMQSMIKNVFLNLKQAYSVCSFAGYGGDFLRRTGACSPDVGVGR